MWYFRSPEIVYGEDALEEFDHMSPTKVLIITDPVLAELGLAERVASRLSDAEVATFAKVEPEPSLSTVQSGAAFATEFEPDLIVAVGGGSVMDAGKAITMLYEHPDIDLEGITPWLPLDPFKSRFVVVPTTSGTGAEATMGAVLTDTETRRKVVPMHPQLLPSLAVVDPSMTQFLPPQITADTGMDVLSHAVDAYSSTYNNAFADGLSLKATEIVFKHLPRAVANGAGDMEAREKMADAATIGGLAINSANINLTHSLGHAVGAYFKQPHGRVVGLMLPYAIEYMLNGDVETRFVDLARMAKLTDSEDEQEGGRALVDGIRALAKEIGQPLSIAELGIDRQEFVDAIETLDEYALSDTSIVCCPRTVEMEDLAKLFMYAYEGKPVDF
jgi:alcohol dehydrogenase class IV